MNRPDQTQAGARTQAVRVAELFGAYLTEHFCDILNEAQIEHFSDKVKSYIDECYSAPTAWTVDECPDANGYFTIRPADGSANGDTDAQPIATVYDAANAYLIAANAQEAQP